jgi:hypothetical protein
MTFIYFIVCGDYIKIGYSDNPEKRLVQMQTGSPIDMSLALKIEGTRATEQEMHSRFSRLRVRGEWFHFDEELRDFVNGHFPPDELAKRRERDAYSRGMAEGVQITLEEVWSWRLKCRNPDFKTTLNSYLERVDIATLIDCVDAVAALAPIEDRRATEVERTAILDAFNAEIERRAREAREE